MHLLFAAGVWPGAGLVSVVVAVAVGLAGFAIRRVNRALVVLAIGSAYLWFCLVYTLGIAPTMSYLVLSGHRSWLPWAPIGNAAWLIAFLVYRVRLTLVREWSQPLDETPGVEVSRANQTIWRELGVPQEGLSRAAIAMLLVFAPLALLTYGTPEYLFVILVLAMQCLTFVTTCVVAWWVAYSIAVYRWEKASGLRLSLPALPLWG